MGEVVMRPATYAALIGGLALALSGCIGTAEDDNPAPAPPPATQGQQPPSPAPPPAAPEPAEAPTDNCGLDPADMDQKTKVQCGLAPEEPAIQKPEPITCPGNNVPVQSLVDGSWYCDYSGGGEGGTGTFDNGEPIPYEPDWSSFEAQCQSGALTIEDGCSSASTPYDDGPGSLYTNPEADPYAPLPPG